MSLSLTAPSSPLAPLPKYARIVPRSTRSPYPPLPRLHNFSARVLSILTSSPLAIVLKIYWNHAFHILKLYRPQQEGKRRAFDREYEAYACLEQSPPSCVPRCHGFSNVRSKNLRFSKRLARDRRYAAGYAEVRMQERWRGLVLDFIPHARPLQTYFEQGICDGLKAKVVAALARVNESGVLHEDAVGRNCLVQRAPSAERGKRDDAVGSEQDAVGPEQDDAVGSKQDDAVGSEPEVRIWWIDFDSASTTGGYEIPERFFRRERERTGEWMRGEMTIHTV